MDISKEEQIDVKGKYFTYGYRIKIGEIIERRSGDVKTFKGVITVLHPSWDGRPTNHMVEYYYDILKGVEYWVDLEKKLLDHKPSIEEREARVEEFSKNVGHLGVLYTISERFGQEPNTVLNWSYGTVFGIVYNDYQRSLFEKRYRKVIQRKK